MVAVLISYWPLRTGEVRTNCPAGPLAEYSVTPATLSDGRVSSRSCSRQREQAARLTGSCPARSPATLLQSVFGLCLCDRLPLHVTRLVPAAPLQGNDVINHVPRAGACP